LVLALRSEPALPLAASLQRVRALLLVVLALPGERSQFLHAAEGLS
jgi:hypothetical protein